MPRMMVYSGNAFAYHETMGLLVAADFPSVILDSYPETSKKN